MKKLAILDTDFISKSHIIRTGEDDHLIDHVLKLPEYEFFCHKQTTIELGRHSSYAPTWLQTRIQSGAITEYTDERIIREMGYLYFKASLSQYTAMLKNACDAFDKNYFAGHFGELNKLDYLRITQEGY